MNGSDLSHSGGSCLAGSEFANACSGLFPGSDAAAVGAYSIELRAWTDRQVDARFTQLLQSPDFSRAVLQSTGAAFSVADRLDSEVRSLRESQASFLEALRGQQNSVADMKREQQALESGLTRWKELLQAEVSERLNAAGPQKEFQDQIVASVVAAVEKKLGAARDGEDARVAAMESTIDHRIDETRHAVLTRLDEARRDLEARCTELSQQARELDVRFREDTSGTEQRILAALRAEMAAAFRNEAAAVTALDQKLRHGIGELAMQTVAREGLRSNGSPAQLRAGNVVPAVVPAIQARVAESDSRSAGLGLGRDFADFPPWSGIQEALQSSRPYRDPVFDAADRLASTMVEDGLPGRAADLFADQSQLPAFLRAPRAAP